MQRYLILSIYDDGDVFIAECIDETRALHHAAKCDMSLVFVIDREHPLRRDPEAGCWGRVIYRAVYGKVFPNNDDFSRIILQELEKQT